MPWTMLKQIIPETSPAGYFKQVCWHTPRAVRVPTESKYRAKAFSCCNWAAQHVDRDLLQEILAVLTKDVICLCTANDRHVESPLTTAGKLLRSRMRISRWRVRNSELEFPLRKGNKMVGVSYTLDQRSVV